MSAFNRIVMTVYEYKGKVEALSRKSDAHFAIATFFFHFYYLYFCQCANTFTRISNILICISRQMNYYWRVLSDGGTKIVKSYVLELIIK